MRLRHLVTLPLATSQTAGQTIAGRRVQGHDVAGMKATIAVTA